MKLPEFDTRNVKPNLYHLIPVTVVLLLVTAGSAWTGLLRTHAGCAGAVYALFFAYVVVQLLIALYRQLEYNPYSYNTIYYIGFSLFFSFVCVTCTVLTAKMIASPEIYTEKEILHLLMNSAEQYLILLFPFAAVFAGGMCVSNLVLIRREGSRFVNYLGIILSVLLIMGPVLIFRLDYYVTGSLDEVRLHSLLMNLFAAVCLYYECMMIGTIAADVIAALYEPVPDKDFMIILGCGLKADGTPTPLLKGRIDRALAFYRHQKETSGKELYFIASGGQGPDEIIPESRAIRNYLVDKGIPQDRILEEDRSTSTNENMKYSAEIIRSINADGRIVFSTSNYHVFRSGLYARRNKIRAAGIGAQTKWYFWPNASVREFIGLLTQHRLKQALILGVLALAYIGITILAYIG